MGEKPRAEDDAESERAVVKSKSNITNNRSEETAAGGDQPAPGAGTSSVNPGEPADSINLNSSRSNIERTVASEGGGGPVVSESTVKSSKSNTSD